ncbi:hypothetical protein CONPUDRAFT_143487 [Coniophora puteana RWD-64-598 SS2]|uniref:Uncharacterized protein n=1 Tax=Coniophora puteana (strain RWD-64-598) TaxID=741705 RepID=A0A5M3MT39_CONPW|nr:uncharacterized protein CONPUDRAFT_143487 [Coniophora puteana RWD-64-598 SS2]EIW81815.1 hypothetical protein CONPUDRAFT_143487 [Coniophora puteana RWD-64-598 SS2]
MSRRLAVMLRKRANVNPNIWLMRRFDRHPFVMSYPKLVALDTDWTIWWGWLDINKLGKGRNAYNPLEDNLEQENGSEWILRDRTNHKERIGMYGKVPDIIYDILKNGAKLAIVSRNKSKPACDRALWWFKATDRKKPIIDMVDFDEVYDGEILFDDEATNNLVRVVEGQSLQSYSDPMFIGFAGMDEQTVNLLTQGHHRVDLTESARWGYAIAKFFAEWIKQDAFGPNAKTYVCELWARDRNKFLATNKIWFPEEGKFLNNVHTQTAFQIGWDQENRDAQAARWGSPTPYILFSRHWRMSEMPPSIGSGRWNEMVIYTQIQDALMLTIPLSEQQVIEKIQLGGKFVPFEQQLSAWNIKVPNETWAEFRKYRENIRA